MQKSLTGALTSSCQRSPGQTTGTKPWAREADPWTQSEWGLKTLNPSIQEKSLSLQPPWRRRRPSMLLDPQHWKKKCTASLLNVCLSVREWRTHGCGACSWCLSFAGKAATVLWGISLISPPEAKLHRGNRASIKRPLMPKGALLSATSSVYQSTATVRLSTHSAQPPAVALLSRQNAKPLSLQSDETSLHYCPQPCPWGRN